MGPWSFGRAKVSSATILSLVYYLAIGLLRTDRMDDAEYVAKVGLERCPPQQKDLKTGFQNIIDSVSAASANAASQSLMDEISSGLNYLRDGDLPKALMNLNEALQENPSNFIARFYFTQVFSRWLCRH